MRDRAAEELGRPRAQRAACGHRDAAVAPAALPQHRLRPLRLEVGAGRAVVEGRLQLAPAALERDPRERLAGGVRIARNRLDLGANLRERRTRVVAADALGAGGAEEQRRAVEAGMRAVGRIQHRMRAVLELELAVAPSGALGALVLAVADADRLACEGVLGARRVEVDLHHLPVALVQVVPVVEGVEEPVLQGQLARGIGLRRDVRVRDGGLPCGHPARPVHVPAAGIEGVAREVEVVVVEAAGEVGAGRRDLDEVGAAPRPAQRDGGISQQRVDVHRQIGLARTAVAIRRDPEHG